MSEKKFRPLYDRVLVKRKKQEERSSGGIIIPDTATKEKPQEGEVVAVGNGKRLDNGQLQPLEVKVGDKILFSKYSGNEIKIDDEEHLVLREDEILGIATN